MGGVPEPTPGSFKPYPAQLAARRQPQLRIFQPAPRQLRLDFSGDIDQGSLPLLDAAESAVATFASSRRQTSDHGATLTFVRVSEAALRTFELHRFSY